MPLNFFDETMQRVKMNPGVGNPNIIRPDGPADPDVGVLAVETLEGRPICLMGSYALPTWAASAAATSPATL